MCIHNDEDDYDCLKCCYDQGVEDALDGFPYCPDYMDFDQCDAYQDGYYDTTKTA